jgi:hypothetical protein
VAGFIEKGTYKEIGLARKKANQSKKEENRLLYRELGSERK